MHLNGYLSRFPEPQRTMQGGIFSQSSYSLRFEWGEHGVEALSSTCDVIIVVDVFSFSTAVSVAVERGAAVLPHRFDRASAEERARRENALLAVRRSEANHLQPYSLSPASLYGLTEGAVLVLPSPNGATCCAYAIELGAGRVLVGSLRNALATAKQASKYGGTIGVIAAGERWRDGAVRPAIEDLIGAGSILANFRSEHLSPEASVAVAAFSAHEAALPAMLQDSISGRELADSGYAQDVRIASELNSSAIAAVWSEDRVLGSIA